jgi:hypothetical protein
VESDRLARGLKLIALLVIAMCAIAMVVGLFPGKHVYRDANDCFGEALGRLFSAHGGGGGSTCAPDYVFVRRELAGGWQLMLALAPVVLGGLAVWRWPRIFVAALWPVIAFVLLVISIAIALDFEIFSLEHTVLLWPSYVVTALVTLVTLILVFLFFAMLVVAVLRVRARRRAERERIPEARVV